MARRGVAIVFDAKQFTGATVFFGTILHELAHDLADGGQAARLEPELPPAKVERITAATKEHIATPYWEDAEGITCAEFVGHDERWIRCCIHLSVRRLVAFPRDRRPCGNFQPHSLRSGAG